MVISKELFKNEYTLGADTSAFLIISFLHLNGVISYEKLIGMFKSLRDKKMLRHVNTFHSKINNKWYSDEHMINILYDIDATSNTPITEMDFSKLLYYTNLYLNKNRNYCIDFIFSEILKPIVSFLSYSYDYYFPSERSIELIRTLKCNDINVLSRDNYAFNSYGYCCEDCSGSYEEYLNMQYRNYLSGKLSKTLILGINKELKMYRIENHPTQIKEYSL